MASGTFYIWGFPGIGKSATHLSEKIQDVDCRRFQFLFPDGIPEDLHNAREWGPVVEDPTYPDNYFEHIMHLDADYVLCNCHISFLERLDKEKILLVYPSAELIPVFLQRFQNRGDNPSFISYMAMEAEGMIRYIEASVYKKYCITEKDVFLADLFQRSDFKVKLMTRKELEGQLQRAKDLDILFLDESSNMLFCALKPAGSDTPLYGPSAESLANDVLDGKFSLDIDKLVEVCAAREVELAQEKLTQDRRGGLSREELADKIMQGIVNGALGIRYGEISPYSHGYAVTFSKGVPPGSTHNFVNRWECYCDFFDIPELIVKRIEDNRQSNEVFGSRPGPLDIQEVLQSIDRMEKEKITSFTPASQTDLVRAKNAYTYPYRSSVATVMDVHAGRGLDGIVQHHYHGDYSTMTPTGQNMLVDSLVCLKGFCLDCIDCLDIGPAARQKVIEYLQKQGIDISTPEKLQKWIRENPDKCGFPENRNRKVSLDNQINSAGNKTEEPKTSEHKSPVR